MTFANFFKENLVRLLVFAGLGLIVGHFFGMVGVGVLLLIIALLQVI